MGRRVDDRHQNGRGCPGSDSLNTRRNSPWIRASALASLASKRNTMTGVVFEARASPKPSLYSTRSPSMRMISAAPGKLARSARCAIIACADASATAPLSSTGEERAGFLHLGLDQRVPRLPQQGTAMMALDPRLEIAGRLHVVDHHCAGIARQHVGREKHQLPVGINDAAVLGHHTQTVAVAVEGQPKLIVRCREAVSQILEILRLRRIRMMIRKMSVDLAEELGDAAAQSPK